MKINVIHDSGCEETEVTIKCAYVDDNLQKVINLLESENPFARPFLSLRFLLFSSGFFAPGRQYHLISKPPCPAIKLLERFIYKFT